MEENMRPEDRRFARGFTSTNFAGSLMAAAAAAAWLLGAVPFAARDSRAQDQKPYTVKEGKVDKTTYNGWRRYTESCLRCHGPDGAGSSYAPSLTDSLKQMPEDEFNEIVVNGRKNVNTANENIMPPFGEVEDVMLYLDDIYAYLKGRADGAIGRGRPERMDE